MIWHIFKKDFRLLRGFALAVTVLPFAIAAVQFRLGHQFDENVALSSLLLLLEMLFYFGVGSLTAAVVHLDSLADVRQDWLVRPVQRRDLLAAKLLFLVLVAQLPLFLANFGGGLADGFGISASFTPALTENLYFLIGFALPVFAFSSLTKNLTEALAGVFTLFLVVMGLEMLVTGTNGGSALGPTTDTGIAWIPQTERLLIYLIAAAAILALQYLRRSTRISRYTLGGAILLSILTQVVPWRYSFNFEKAISGAPSAEPVLSFDPSLGKFHSPVSAGPDSSAAQVGEARRIENSSAEIYLPLQISGVPAGSILKIDSVAAHLFAANGKHIGDINNAREEGGFEVLNDGASGSSLLSHFEAVPVRNNIFNRVKNTPVTMQIDYSATLMKLASTESLPTSGANRRIPGVGWCRTELNDSKTSVELRCLAAGTLPQCTTAFLQNPGTGAHNPDLHGCLDDYSPYFGRYKPPDIIRREGFNLTFRDTAGLVRYPVDGSQIGSAQVVLKSYSVAGQFTARLVIPSIRLADWAAQ